MMWANRFRVGNNGVGIHRFIVNKHDLIVCCLFHEQRACLARNDARLWPTLYNTNVLQEEPGMDYVWTAERSVFEHGAGKSFTSKLVR